MIIMSFVYFVITNEYTILQVRQSQDEEKRQLVELKNLLKTSVNEGEPPGKNSSVYNLHQLQVIHSLTHIHYNLKKNKVNNLNYMFSRVIKSMAMSMRDT